MPTIWTCVTPSTLSCWTLLGPLLRSGTTSLLTCSAALVFQQPLDWITDFLSNRTQTVIYSDSVSAPISVTSGVIQGSVLGPLLFVGLINYLPEQASHCNVILFTDDSKAIGAAAENHEQDLVQQDLNSVGSWSEVNHLPLSIGKCMCIYYGLHNKKRSSSRHGTTIKNTDQCDQNIWFSL